MNVRLTTPCTGDLDEFGFRTHILDIPAAGVTHRRAHAADQLMHDRDQTAFVRHAPFDAFGHELFDLFRCILKVTIGRTMALRHRTQ
jgi:hypothetical protein